MDHGMQPVAVQHPLQQRAVADRAEHRQQNRPGLCRQGLQFPHHLAESQLAQLQQNNPRHPARGELAAQFRPDGAACAGDQNGTPRKGRARAIRRICRCPAEKPRCKIC